DHRDLAVLLVLMREGEAGAERYLGTDDAVAAVELLLGAEHVHRAALALGVSAGATRELGHDALGVHAAGEHMAVVAVGGDDGVALFGRRLHADHHGLLADIEMAEAADQAHAVELAGLLLEAADQQHVAVMADQVFCRELGWLGRRGLGGRWFGCGLGHGAPFWITGRMSVERGLDDWVRGAFPRKLGAAQLKFNQTYVAE